MGLKNEYNLRTGVKDIFVVVFLATLIIIRIISNNSFWIGLISYISVLIALVDLFYEIVITYKKRRGISIVLIIGVLIGIILVVVLACLLTNVITINPVIVDILSIFALMISLPHKLYVCLLGLILSKEEYKNADG